MDSEAAVTFMMISALRAPLGVVIGIVLVGLLWARAIHAKERQREGAAKTVFRFARWAQVVFAVSAPLALVGGYLWVLGGGPPREVWILLAAPVMWNSFWLARGASASVRGRMLVAPAKLFGRVVLAMQMLVVAMIVGSLPGAYVLDGVVGARVAGADFEALYPVLLAFLCLPVFVPLVSALRISGPTTRPRILVVTVGLLGAVVVFGVPGGWVLGQVAWLGLSVVAPFEWGYWWGAGRITLGEVEGQGAREVVETGGRPT